MTENIQLKPPDAEEADLNSALEHLHEAEIDLEKARADEEHAVHALEEAAEEIKNAKRHEHWIVVNGQRKVVDQHRLTFDEIVALAFNPVPQGPDVQFSVQYTRGPEGHHKGTLVEGQSVEVKNGMEFDVTPTNRS